MPQLLRYATLALLGSLLTLPFLGAHHFLPIATFHQEWLAGVLGLLLLGVLLIGNDSVQWQMPRVALLPLFFVVALWLQWAAGIGVLFESACLASLYLIWASLMMIGTCRLELRFGRDDLANTIALALLIGALLLAGTGIAQLLLPGIGLPWIFPYRGVVEGNIAQSNSFAAYLWIGVAAGLHLHLRSRLAWPMAIAATLPLLSCSLLSGSRSVYFYAAALTLWLIVQARSETTRAPRRRALICAATLLPALLL